MRESVKQMKDVNEFVNTLPCLVTLVFRNICLVTKQGQTQHKLMWFVLIERQFM